MILMNQLHYSVNYSTIAQSFKLLFCIFSLSFTCEFLMHPHIMFLH